MIRQADSFNASSGKDIGFGRPPAKEITDGSCVTFSMSRMNEEGVDKILSE